MTFVDQDPLWQQVKTGIPYKSYKQIKRLKIEAEWRANCPPNEWLTTEGYLIPKEENTLCIKQFCTSLTRVWRARDSVEFQPADSLTFCKSTSISIPPFRRGRSHGSQGALSTQTPCQRKSRVQSTTKKVLQCCGLTQSMYMEPLPTNWWALSSTSDHVPLKIVTSPT